MRADIHDGPEHMLQSEAGYIDARPLTPARQNLLQRTAGPYIGSFASILPCPSSCRLSTTPDITTSDGWPSVCRRHGVRSAHNRQPAGDRSLRRANATSIAGKNFRPNHTEWRAIAGPRAFDGKC